MKYRKEEIQQQKQSTLQKIENIHPHKMLMYLSILGIALIFLFLIVAFSISVYTSENKLDIQVPKFFVISTFVIIASSFSLSKVVFAYEKDNAKQLLQNLRLTLILGVSFCLLQIVGWNELQHSKIYFIGDKTGTYLYFISGLHIAHLLGGIIFLAILLFKTQNVLKEPVKRLVFVTNPHEKMKFVLLGIYWHFMDILWVVLFIHFLFAF